MRKLLWISACYFFATGCTCQRDQGTEASKEGMYVTDDQQTYHQEIDGEADTSTMPGTGAPMDSRRSGNEMARGADGSMDSGGPQGGERIIANPEVGYYQTFEDAQPDSPLSSPEAQQRLASIREKAPQFQGNQHTLPDPQAIYLANCSRCHGIEGRGDGPEEVNLGIAPTNFQEWDLKFGQAIENIVYSVTYGQSEEEMPAFKEDLKEQEIWAVSILIHQWIQNRPSER